MNKSASIAVRLPAETKDALEKMAQDDFRTLSSLIEKLLTEAAREKGYLSESSDLRDARRRPDKGRNK
jgi:hypothetical protein